MSIVMMIPLLIGCVPLHTVPPVAGGDAAAAQSTQDAGPPPVSFAPLEERVNVLVADAQETDRRDRLIADRELMHTMRNTDPVAQRKVYAYLDEVLKIEERSKPAALGTDAGAVPIEEEPLPSTEEPLPSAPPTPPGASAPASPAPSTPSPGTPVVPGDALAPVPPDETKAIAAAHVALSDARYLDAVALLDPLATPAAAALKKEAIDGWARAERERAGHLFLEARALPPGGERVASLKDVRAKLAAINERFPNNAYASQIADNLAKVDADLAAAGVTP